jgi:hypothetical protein
MVWGGKFEAIVESEKYDTLTVNKLFSKLKSAEVDQGMTSKIEGPTDSHSLALIGGSKGKDNANTSTRMFSLSSLMSVLDEEFDVLGEDELALLTWQFERLHAKGEHEEHEDMLSMRQARTLRRRLPREVREQGQLQAQVEDGWQGQCARMVRDLGQIRLVREAERISQSHKNPPQKCFYP